MLTHAHADRFGEALRFGRPPNNFRTMTDLHIRPLVSVPVLLLVLLGGALGRPAQATERSFYAAELIFPLETWHDHASCIVEAPNGDLLVCWFHGSGERTADDVKIEGARLRKGALKWSERFTLADAPAFEQLPT
jgi:hypothetical protein